MRDVHYMKLAEKAMAQLCNPEARGAFLTVRSGALLNTMTIGWVQIGFMWKMPVMTVAVRKTRHTCGLIESAPDFTVTFPWDGEMGKALEYCGTHSGKNGDKFEACGLTAASGRSVQSPIVACRGLHYECRIVLRSPMDPARMEGGLASLYRSGDYHTLYAGEIVSCYETDRFKSVDTALG
ncbi:flavin reductase family protein [Candidatus Sumerlaeota bacterium]|nr:flavin reductase family protein [Candidatus Sumerlaeota bacterium]